jgi:hypothetical protein
MLFDREQQTWYDRLAGTRTLLLRKDAGRRRATNEAD